MPLRNSSLSIEDLSDLSHLDELVVDKRFGQRSWRPVQLDRVKVEPFGWPAANLDTFDLNQQPKRQG